jgi:hypothetical protein
VFDGIGIFQTDLLSNEAMERRIRKEGSCPLCLISDLCSRKRRIRRMDNGPRRADRNPRARQATSERGRRSNSRDVVSEDKRDGDTGGGERKKG